MKLKQLLSYTRRAVDDYHMITDGDRIAVGISGGKDSLTLLYALSELKRFYPKSFSLEALTVDMGFQNLDLSNIHTFCAQFGVSHTVIKTDIAEIVFNIRKETNPCSLCAKMRKGAFNQAAVRLGCSKVAYAHQRDDMVETMLMSMIYEGRFHCFSPSTALERTGLTVIRPLMYVSEAEVIGFQNKYHLPVCKSPCPADGHTKREYVKQLVRTINRENPGAAGHMFSALLKEKDSEWTQ